MEREHWEVFLIAEVGLEVMIKSPDVDTISTMYWFVITWYICTTDRHDI